MSFRAIALMRALSNGGFRRSFYPWRYQAVQPFWVTAEEISPSVSCWRRWDPFPDFEQIFGFAEKDGAENSSEARKVGNKTIGHVSDDKNFVYNFDLSGFNPKDIKVKTLGQKLLVEAETQEKEEKKGIKSFSHRQYHRSLLLPNNVNPQELKSSLTDTGVLSIRAPLLEIEDEEVKERELEIEREETPAVEEKPKKQDQ